MPHPPSDLAPIIGPTPPAPTGSAASQLPWEAGLVGLALALVLMWLALRLISPHFQLRSLQRAATREDPRQVAHRLARLMARRYHLPYISSASCPVSVNPVAWQDWVTDLDAVRFGMHSRDHELTVRLCHDAQELMARS